MDGEMSEDTKTDVPIESQEVRVLTTRKTGKSPQNLGKTWTCRKALK